MMEMRSEHDFAPGQLVVPDNMLKKKVGQGGFSEAVLVRAQSKIDNNTIDFRPVARDYSQAIAKLLKGLRAASVIDSVEAIELIMYPVMQLRAQGSMFKYPSITKISHVLMDCLDNVTIVDGDVLDLVEGYHKSLNAMIALQIKSENDKAARDLTHALSAACARYEAKIKAKK